MAPSSLFPYSFRAQQAKFGLFLIKIVKKGKLLIINYLVTLVDFFMGTWKCRLGSSHNAWHTIQVQKSLGE